MQCFLFDNGSLRPEACRQLRGIAQKLSARLGLTVTPVSLLHSSAIDPALLDGEPAVLLESALRTGLAAGKRRFILLPLFLGPSRALTDYLPRRLAALRAIYPDMQVRLAPCLVPNPSEEQRPMVKLLYDQVHRVMNRQGLDRPAVVLVDHGTPVRAVNTLRNNLAVQLADRLGNRVKCLSPASMERRPGPDYAFNEPLLEHLLAMPGYNRDAVIVALLFLLPGRHAGPGGDIAAICTTAEANHPKLKMHRTALVGEHPKLIAILHQRFAQALEVC